MTKTFENKQLKLHHILLVSLLITPLLVLYSKVMNKRGNKEGNREIENFEESVILRKLCFTEDTNAIKQFVKLPKKYLIIKNVIKVLKNR